MVSVPPLFSANLPLAKGQFKVGYIPITHKPIVPFTHPQPIHQDTNLPGLKVHDISYSVFYPTINSEGTINPSGVNWVPEPFWEIIKGYQKFGRGKIGISDTYIKWIGGTLGYVTGRIKIPVSTYAPLRPPTDSTKYPLVIFSHGLAGTRHTYSQFCSDLASEGYVVLAVEHKDGSGPAVYIENDEEEQNGDSEVDNKILHCIRYEDLEFPAGEEKSLVKIGVLQVDIRLREVYEAYHSFKNLVNFQNTNSSDSNSVSSISSITGSDIEGLNILKEVDEAEENFDKKLDWISSLNGKIDTENLRLTGHSYGGGTMLHIIQNPSPHRQLLPELPIKQVLVLDPWLEAVPEPIPSDSDKASPEMPPILAINSIGFTEWTEHFDSLMGMLKKANGNLCSIIGVKHQSFSDFPLLDPRSHKAAKHLLNRIQDLSLTFLKGDLNELAQFKGNQSNSGIVLPNSNSNGKLDLEGKVDGDIIIHLIGQE